MGSRKGLENTENMCEGCKFSRQQEKRRGRRVLRALSLSFSLSLSLSLPLSLTHTHTHTHTHTNNENKRAF